MYEVAILEAFHPEKVAVFYTFFVAYISSEMYQSNLFGSSTLFDKAIYAKVE